MNARERQAVDRIDGVLRIVGSLNPPNPADTKAIFANLRKATNATKAVTRAISSLRCQDWDDVAMYLDEAAAALGTPDGGQR